MAVATALHSGSYFPSKIPSPPITTAKIKSTTTPPPPPPLFISTNPLHVNTHHLRDLYTICNHSCHRFPSLDPAGKIEPVDLPKLRTAITHSSVVVSAFTKPEFVMIQSNSGGIGGDWIGKLTPVTPENGQLVGFGRAVSDCALTASIYDVMVHPDLRGRGIGRTIIQRIIRMLTNRDIYDIAALSADKDRLFLRACGFGDDVLGSTTMMYTRGPSGYSEDEQVICAGRKLLLYPHPRKLSIK